MTYVAAVAGAAEGMASYAPVQQPRPHRAPQVYQKFIDDYSWVDDAPDEIATGHSGNGTTAESYCEDNSPFGDDEDMQDEEDTDGIELLDLNEGQALTEGSDHVQDNDGYDRATDPDSDWDPSRAISAFGEDVFFTEECEHSPTSFV
jgi:hypothetical protein